VKRIAATLAAALSLALPVPLAAAPVNAADYEAFWLWAGVKPQPVLAQARSLYILQGQVEFSRHDPAAQGHLIDQGGAAPRLREVEIWIVYRAHTLNWSSKIYAQILGHLRRWRAKGVPVVGIQLDFDARTRHLDKYQAFLRDFRQRLPEDCKLSITGLLDWSSHGDSSALNDLGRVVDEVVLQTYQGRKTIPSYADYLDNLQRLTIPFKIGLIQGGEWSPPPTLATHPNFRGYVVFLLNDG